MRIEPFATGNKRRVSKSGDAPKAAQTRRAAVRAIDLSAVPPLQWWRHLPADVYTVAHLDILRKSISGIIIMNEPRWPDAVRGNPAVAIGIALRAAKRRSMTSPGFDLVMSALLLTALAGDPASRLMLTTMIKRYRADNKNGWLAASWSSVCPNAERTVSAKAVQNPRTSISRRMSAEA